MHFVNPNYHVILIHYPLGVFMVGVIIELFGFLGARGSIRAAGRWMILIGGLATLPAATSGVYALSDALNSGSAWTAPQAHMLRMHTWLQSIATLLATFIAVFLIAASDGWRRRFRWFALFALLACAGLMVSGAWFGGETVYTQGTAVTVGAAASPPQARPSTADRIIYYTGEPIQLHMIFAGVTFALAFAALGLSIRKITVEYPDVEHLPLITETPSDDPHGASAPADSFSRSPLPILAPTDLPEEECVPAGCFWLVAALAALLTLASGYCIWALAGRHWLPKAFWNELMVKHGNLVFDRAAVHVWVGVSLLILTFLLAALSRWAPRQKAVLAIFASLLVLAIAAQVWLGVLLQFDGGDGPLYRFSPPDKSSAILIPSHGSSTFSTSSV